MADNELKRTARDIAHELGDDWSLDVDCDYYAARILRCSDGAALIINAGPSYLVNMRGRLVIRGSYPHRSGGYIDPAHKAEITVSAEKSAKQIASDITTRLLPKYVKNLAVVKQRQTAEDRAAEARAKVAAEISAITREQARDDQVSLYDFLGEGYGTAKVSYHADTISLELHCLPTEQALAVLRPLSVN